MERRLRVTLTLISETARFHQERATNTEMRDAFGHIDELAKLGLAKAEFESEMVVESPPPRPAEERLLVKVGLDWLRGRMTQEEARQYGEHHMPPEAKAAGFNVVVNRSNPEFRGGDWYRIDYQ